MLKYVLSYAVLSALVSLPVLSTMLSTVNWGGLFRKIGIVCTAINDHAS